MLLARSAVTRMHFHSFFFLFANSPVRLQQLYDVGVLEHVADCGLPLEIIEAEAGRGRELGHIDDLNGELLVRLPMDAPADQ